MAPDNQLRARVQPSHADHISEIAEDRFDGEQTEAERYVVKEGLESLGYEDRPTDAAELLLYYLRRIGLMLGLVGLIMMGYGVFGPRSWGIIGFGLLLGGFLFLFLEEGLAAYSGWAASRHPVVDRTKEHA